MNQPHFSAEFGGAPQPRSAAERQHLRHESPTRHGSEDPTEKTSLGTGT